METVNPSTFPRINGERPSNTLGTSPEFIEGRSRTIKFYTLGCKVNQYDTQNIRERFMQAGLRESENSEPSDIYVINTCTVTHKADSESLNFIRRAKRENPKAKIIVTGCLTELDEDEIKRIGGIDLIVKNKDKKNIVKSFFRLFSDEEINELNVHNKQTNKGISYFKGHTRAFLKIQDGCQNHCSYCKVPLVRGPLSSKPLSEIIEETEALVKNGIKEIVLTGICLGAYGRDLKQKVRLVNVIEAFEDIEGLLRLRLSSIEAGDISDALIKKIVHSKKLCRHLHIPIQSGDDTILKKMKRNYCRNDYLKLIRKIRKFVPEIAISTDVLLGFPGENETNFKNTCELIKEIIPLKTHIFRYSRREGTSSTDDFREELSPLALTERAAKLKSISDLCALLYIKQFLDRSMDVLVEGRAKDNPAFWQGHTDNYIKVRFKSKENLKNRIIKLKLKKVAGNSVLAVRRP